MRTILSAAIGILLLAALPQQAQAQNLWERAERAIEEARQEHETRRGNERAQETRGRDDQRQADRNAPQRTQQPARQANRQRGQQANQRGGAAGGPVFCRTGEGHPTRGMNWCYEKGFATPAWSRGSLGSIIFDRRATQTRTSQTMSRRQVETILGRDGTRRAQDHGRQYGIRGDLSGRWIDRNTMEILIGGVPVARLTDSNGNGRVDRTLVARYR